MRRKGMLKERNMGEEEGKEGIIGTKKKCNDNG
jgi:hypothetical protein